MEAVIRYGIVSTRVISFSGCEKLGESAWFRCLVSVESLPALSQTVCLLLHHEGKKKSWFGQVEAVDYFCHDDQELAWLRLASSWQQLGRLMGLHAFCGETLFRLIKLSLDEIAGSGWEMSWHGAPLTSPYFFCLQHPDESRADFLASLLHEQGYRFWLDNSQASAVWHGCEHPLHAPYGGIQATSLYEWQSEESKAGKIFHARSHDLDWQLGTAYTLKNDLEVLTQTIIHHGNAEGGYHNELTFCPRTQVWRNQTAHSSRNAPSLLAARVCDGPTFSTQNNEGQIYCELMDAPSPYHLTPPLPCLYPFTATANAPQTGMHFKLTAGTPVALIPTDASPSSWAVLGPIKFLNQHQALALTSPAQQHLTLSQNQLILEQTEHGKLQFDQTTQHTQLLQKKGSIHVTAAKKLLCKSGRNSFFISGENWQLKANSANWHCKNTWQFNANTLSWQTSHTSQIKSKLTLQMNTHTWQLHTQSNGMIKADSIKIDLNQCPWLLSMGEEININAGQRIILQAGNARLVLTPQKILIEAEQISLRDLKKIKWHGKVSHR